MSTAIELQYIAPSKMKLSDFRTFSGIEYHSKVYVLSWIVGVFVIGRKKDNP